LTPDGRAVFDQKIYNAKSQQEAAEKRKEAAFAKLKDWGKTSEIV
jgi:protein subunit release factor B